MHLTSLVVNDGTHTRASVIWLHGLGADGHDFEPVAHALNLPHIRFVLPHAPYRPVTLNHGYDMRAWYDIFGLQSDSAQDSHGIRAMQTEHDALIAAELARGRSSQQIVLAGFSQGGAMCLHTATRYPQPLGGVFALSTYLPLADTLDDELHAANRQLPIWMAHGRYDSIITLETAQRSCDRLREVGLPVSWQVYDMPHSVCEEELNDIRRTLLTWLPA